MDFFAIFENEGNGDENESTFFSLATEFFEAALVLQRTPPTHIKYSIVIYYLLGHSAELALKSFLYNKSMTAKDLKKVGHNLEKLSDMAKSMGLIVPTTQIVLLSECYNNKRFEYRNQKASKFPSIDLLIQEVKSLQSCVFDNISTL